MPAELETLPDVGTPEADAHNDEVKRTVAEQGTPKQPELQEAAHALDEIAQSLSKEKEEAAAAEPVVVEKTEKEESVLPKEPDAAADAAVKAEQERAEALKKSEDLFKGSPGLPPGASPKSSEAFAAVKIKAAQEIAARDKELEETRAKLAEAEAKANQGPDPELQRELEDHRTWRARLDVEADPKFKEFDKQVVTSQEFIYSQLRKSPNLPTGTIEKIKEYGGPENVNLEKIFAALRDPTTQRIIESKVADIEVAKFSKEEAIKSAKANIGQYVEEQRKAFAGNATAHNSATEKEFSELSTRLTWLAPRAVDPKAEEATRKGAEEHNKFIVDTKAQLAEALRDDSPKMRAIMLAGMAQLLHLQHVRAAEKAVAEATKKSFDDQLVAIKKERDELTTKLAKFTNASVGRLREGGAPPGGRTEKSATVNFETRTADALDAIAAQVTAERAKKANA